jgi:beta-phosphoglucomutase-like phosphatase (HAD superfamily)
MGKLKALIFDCDGVIAETERDGHRVSFNRVFKEMGINAEWSVEEYQELLNTAGGKERMKYYFERNSNTYGEIGRDEQLIAALHKRKTEIFMEMCANGEMPARYGIKRLINEAHEKGILLAVCSTSNEKSVETLIKSSVGDEEFLFFSGIFAGDIVKKKKPSPDIYNMVKDKFKLKGEECFVVEDNRNGLLAAKGAGMYCIITVSFYSHDEDFKEADLVVSSLGDPGIPVMISKSDFLNKARTEFITIGMLEKFIEKPNG